MSLQLAAAAAVPADDATMVLLKVMAAQEETALSQPFSG
jgi:hypothetical protein